MAANHVAIDESKDLGRKIKRLVGLQREALNLMHEIKDVAEAQIDGMDYSVFEARAGIPTGKGMTVYNLVTGARTEVNVANVQQMLNWLG
jgi:hypothetical protein